MQSIIIFLWGAVPWWLVLALGCILSLLCFVAPTAAPEFMQQGYNVPGSFKVAATAQEMER
jgi:hypothetical protein